MPRELKFHQNVSRITGILYEGQYTFLIVSRAVLLRERKVSNITCRENQNTHFNFENFFFPKIVPFMI
jgi:hypothetical protein